MINRKTIIALAVAAMPLTTMAQGKFVKFFTDRHILPATTIINKDGKEKKYSWFNHLDFAITGGTSGIGFDLAVPMSEWAQLRVGGVFRPLKTYTATFTTEMAGAYTKEEIDRNFSKMSSMMKTFTNVTPDRSIQMTGDLKMNHFKMLVDVFPIKKHRNFHVTLGFYYGNSTLIEANTRPENVKTLAAINTFNSMYKKALAKENPMDLYEVAKSMNIDKPELKDIKLEAAIKKLRNWGASDNKPTEITDLALTYINKEFFGDDEEIKILYAQRPFAEYGLSIALGKYAHDIIATEDVYWDYTVKYDDTMLEKDPSRKEDIRELNIIGIDKDKFENIYDIDGVDANGNGYKYGRDANGRPIVEKINGQRQLRYKKGEVMHKAGDPIRLTPDELNQLSAKSTVNKFKPYVGVGYSLPITKDKRTCFSVDAGVMFWGGTPSVDVRVPSGVDADGRQLYTNINLVKDATDMPKKVEDYVSTIKSYPVFPEISLRISQRLW